MRDVFDYELHSAIASSDLVGCISERGRVLLSEELSCWGLVFGKPEQARQETIWASFAASLAISQSIANAIHTYLV